MKLDSNTRFTSFKLGTNLALITCLLALPQPQAVAQSARPRLVQSDHHPALPQTPLGHIGVVSTNSIPGFVIHRPRTKAKAAKQYAEDGATFEFTEREAISYVQDLPPQTDNLSPLVVAAFVIGVAEAGRVKSVLGAVGGTIRGNLAGVSSSRFRPADAAMTAVERQINLQDALRSKVVEHARLRAVSAVTLVEKPFPPGLKAESLRMATMMCATLAWVPDGQRPDDYLSSQGFDTKLEIEIRHPGLKGKPVTNPSLSLCLDVNARLVRLQDGMELAACSLQYRGPKRKFTQWAAHDARLFREELDHCCDSVSRTIVDELFAQAPTPGSQAILASNR